MLRYTACLNTLRVDVAGRDGAEAIARELPRCDEGRVWRKKDKGRVQRPLPGSCPGVVRGGSCKTIMDRRAKT
eukprot:1157298-Pelagomonas_calceolata.AAC.16